MDTFKVYQDSEGNNRTIWHMVKHEPEWAANRIQAGESALEQQLRQTTDFGNQQTENLTRLKESARMFLT